MEFLEAVTRAEAEAELRMIAQWQAQIPRDWRAARDFLARRFPKRWGPNARVEVDHYGELYQFQKAPPTTEWLASDRKFLIAVQVAYEEIIRQNQNGKNSKD